MNVLVTSIYYPPRLGGIENHVYYLAHALARRGCGVSVVTSRSEADSPRRESSAGVDVERVPLPAMNAVGWMANAVASIPAALRRGRGADIVHAHTFQSALPALPAALGAGKPLVVTIHSSHFLKMVTKPHWRAVFRRLLRPAALILAPSHELADACRRVVPQNRIETIVNGIDTDLFRPVAPALARREGRFILVASRRLVQKNGVRYLVDAMPAIGARAPSDLYLIGVGPEQADLEARVARHGLADRVHFVGGVANADLPPLLSSADAVVLPSLLEATSLAALEAMACERPMAVSRVGGLPELVDDTCGVLFNPADPADLAANVSSLLLRPASERAALGARARRRVVDAWSIEALADRHMRYYRELLDGVGRAA